MNKQTLAALLAFAVSGLVAFAVLRSPEKGQRQGEKPRPLGRVKSGMDFDTIEVVRGKDTTVIKKDGDKYRITAPMSYAADDYGTKQAFEAFDKLEWGDVVSEQKARHGEFEVGADALRVKAVKDGKVLANLIVGKAVGPYTLVRVDDKDQVWQAVGSLKSTFDKDTSAWRDKTISSLKPEDVESIEVKATRGGLIQVRREQKPDGGASDATWSVATTPVKIPTLDQSIPAGIVSAMQSLKANEFADGVKPEEAGVGDAASFVVTARLKGGKSVSIFVGKKKGDDDWYVKDADSSQIFLVKKYSLDRMLKPPIEFRDKTLCNLAEADVTEVAVTHGADSFTVVKNAADWKATRPAGLEVDGTKVTPMLAAFKDWKAASFAEDPSPKATGLGKPQATIAARTKVASCTLRIGDETKDKQNYYAQPAGSPDVYLLAKWNADRVLKKLDDIRKPGSKK